ncbi:Hsp20/alpha crystallin family protein [[Eubacterium] cellulosolvens]
MGKKTPWWRKPFDKDDDNEYEKELEDDNVKDEEYEENRDKAKKSPRRPYGYRDEDWVPRRGLFRSPFDDDFDSIFGRSPIGTRGDFFMDIERDFAEMHERMDRMFKQAMEGKIDEPGPGGPFVYGFSMRTGPDGVPHIQEFGNMPPEMRNRLNAPRRLPLTSDGELSSCATGSTRAPVEENREIDSRKPLTDILDCDDHFTITMELPGIEKQDIDLEVLENELEVNVDTPIRKYYNKLPLPGEVDPKSIKANFKNGVLDIYLKRLKPKPKKGKRIKIN